jgi:hypothetical protein
MRRASTLAYGVSKQLFGDLDAAPKGDMIFNGFRRFFRLRVVSGGILIGSIVDLNVVVACDALPGTGGVGFARRKISRLIESGGK